MAGMQTHRVLPGETLASIAKDYYGSTDDRYGLVIWHHNRDVMPTYTVVPGTELVIPHLMHRID
jgi:hypothetical protein